jgi:hypothetical protein
MGQAAALKGTRLRRTMHMDLCLCMYMCLLMRLVLTAAPSSPSHTLLRCAVPGVLQDPSGAPKRITLPEDRAAAVDAVAPSSVPPAAAREGARAAPPAAQVRVHMWGKLPQTLRARAGRMQDSRKTTLHLLRGLIIGRTLPRAGWAATVAPLVACVLRLQSAWPMRTRPLPEPHLNLCWRRWLYNRVHEPWFEAVVTAIIVVNSLCMALTHWGQPPVRGAARMSARAAVHGNTAGRATPQSTGKGRGAAGWQRTGAVMVAWRARRRRWAGQNGGVCLHGVTFQQRLHPATACLARVAKSAPVL